MKTMIVIATAEQLAIIGITDVPSGAIVKAYDIDQYSTAYGKGSKVRYKYYDFEYIIPTRWLK